MEKTSAINIRLLKSKMALQGFSKKDLCRESGVSSGTIDNLFYRDNRPNSDTMEAIAKALKLNSTEFMQIFFADYLRKTQVVELNSTG